MAKVTTITPIHIASGSNYSAYTHNNKVYDLGYILTLCSLSKCQNSDFLCKEGNLSNKEFIDRLEIDKSKIDDSHSIFKTDKLEITGIVSENVKTLDNLIIPGSTLKGYIMNLLWYHIISSNDKVRKHLISKYDKIDNEKKDFKQIKKKSDINRGLIDKIVYIQELLEVRDLNFNNRLEIDLYKKYKKYNGILKIKSYIEVLPINSTWEGELFKLKDSYSMKLSNNIENKIEEQIKKGSNYEINKLQLEILYEIKYVLNKNNFKKWFIETNKKFMLEVMKYEKEFINNCCNKSVDVENIKLIYDDVIKRLNNNEIIIQIGKYTNFILKSFDIAFGSYYEEKFKKIFSPMTNKSTPKLDTVSLIEKNGLGSLPLGFLKIEL